MPAAEDVSGIRVRAALIYQPRALGLEVEEALELPAVGGLDMDVRDRDEDLVQEPSLVKRFQHHRSALAVQITYPELAEETLVRGAESGRVDFVCAGDQGRQALRVASPRANKAPGD